MSKNHRESRKPAYADWTVFFADDLNRMALVTESRFTRDEHGGYVFTDSSGVTADFAPGIVSHVMRKDEPEPIRFMLGPGFAKLSPNQVREMQDTLRACPGLAGLILVPYGSKIGADLESLDSRA